MRVFITGTPGTGKSVLAAAIGDEFQVPVFNVGVQARVMGLVEGRDEEMDADIVPEEAVERIAAAIEAKHDDFVLEGHMAHYAHVRTGTSPARDDADADTTSEAIMICATCPIEVLKDRLEERGYAEAKVRENLDAEIFQVCRTEAEEAGWSVIVYDSSTEDAGDFARSLSDRTDR